MREMKWISLLFWTFISPFLLKGQELGREKLFTLAGNIIGKDSGIISLEYLVSEGKYLRDSAKIKGGNFFFKGFINHPVAADLLGDVISRGTSDFNTTTVFLEPGVMKITLAVNDFKHAMVIGSRSQEELESLTRHNSFQKQLDSLEKEYILSSNAYRANRNDSLLKGKCTLLRNQLDPYYIILRENNIKFIATHPDSYVSAYLLQTYVSRLSFDSSKLLFNNLNLVIRNCSYGKKIEQKIRAIEGGLPGELAKNFNTIDINGTPVSLSDFKGKQYVLLDFWASWCVPCRESNPFLIQLYKKFHSKGFEIIGIANDDNSKKDWQKAIGKDRIGMWRHVLQGVGSPDDIGKKFGIVPIPAKILIDKTGVILLRYEGSNDIILENKLLQLFGDE